MEKATEFTANQKAIVFLNRYLIWLSLILAILILAAGYFFLLSSQWENLNRSAAQIKNSEKDLAEFRAQQAIIEGLKKIPAFSGADEALLKLALPEKFELSSFIIQWENLAKKFGFGLASVSLVPAPTEKKAADKNVNTAVPAAKVKSVLVKISLVGGDYERFKDFLQAAENSLMALSIESIDFTAQDKYDVGLKVFYYDGK